MEMIAELTRGAPLCRVVARPPAPGTRGHLQGRSDRRKVDFFGQGSSGTIRLFRGVILSGSVKDLASIDN